MDWLKRMHDVVEYIEFHLDSEIDYEFFGKTLYCSTYEFSRVFSFITGVSISEYIRRRRLSQAALDIQSSREKIIDIALKYNYESQAAFTRAFKEFHGQKPLSARQNGVTLKAYPKISFVLTIKGVNEMNYRIEKKETFKIIGLKGVDSVKCEDGDKLTLLWREFMDNYNHLLWNGGNSSYYTAPFWQVGAYEFNSNEGETTCIIGAELQDKPVLNGMDIVDIPDATWAVFTFNSPTGIDYVPQAYTRILTEWFPNNKFERNKYVPHLEVFPAGDINSKDYKWEIWIPVVHLKKR